ncbi:MAG TPA: RNA-binding S4 domain-containing protein [Rudaea sp.]|nr:RNA-binding S4 domain-containing protein [Rudaea sp.]
MTERTPENALQTARLDAWLWATRFFKTRAVAKKAIEGGHVRVDGRDVRPSAAVRIGQRLRIERSEEIFEVDVVELITRRAPAPMARACFHETPESIAARESAAEQRRLLRDGYERPPTKPDKRARRLIRALGDIDMF